MSVNAALDYNKMDFVYGFHLSSSKAVTKQRCYKN